MIWILFATVRLGVDSLYQDRAAAEETLCSNMGYM
jgi:hypothetical protein